MKTIGIILIVIGIVMIVLKGINFQTEKKVADVGPIEVNKKEDHHIGWPTYVGGIVIVGGIVLTVVGSKSKKKQIS